MNRIATPLTAIAATAVLLTSGTAADPSVDRLNSRIVAIETRLASIEKALSGESSSSYTYEQATVDATNDAQTAAQKAPESRSSRTYVIKDGDKLSTIAEKFGVDRKALLETNRLSEGQPIYIGETLMIPGAGEEGAVADSSRLEPAKEKSIVVGDTKPSAEEGSNGTVHTVVKGDTLMGLSRKHSASVAAIKSANGLRSDVITPGQKLTIPAGAASATGSTQLVSHKTASGGDASQKAEYEYDNELLRSDETYGYYTVRKGDNLFSLGEDFFTSMAELQRLNRLGKSTLIHPGDDLIVPTSRYNNYHNKNGVAQN
ncbi:MAG: LysM peptidoglycan-binding domain-containing protein [Verrucomicrobiales bacterium]